MAIPLKLTPSRIQETWEKMRPENRYGQMTPSEHVAFALSEEGKNYLFPWGFTIDGKRYEKMVPGRVARVFAEESRLTEQSYSREECSSIFRTAFLLFTGYVDAATTFAKTAEAVDPPQTRTGAAIRTKTTSSGPAAASAKHGRWSQRL